jgi:NAD(P)-dependent dehydrogenase (short-subunit alcohol dehydrogenase family)
MLRKPGAAVINISASQATMPKALQSHVCAAKAGVEMLTRVLALEWAHDGIRVNAVVPGPIAGTEGMRRLAPTEEAHDIVIRSVPLGRLGSAADVAKACMFLSSSHAAYITGSVLLVDGGWSLGGGHVAASAVSALLGIPGAT